MTDARAAILKLLAQRTAPATICPSEAARAVATHGDWRHAMPEVHTAVDGLHADGLVQLSWKGHKLAKRAGPYRISKRDGALE